MSTELHIEDIKFTRYSPKMGDVLIFRLPAGVPPGELRHIRSKLRLLLPDVNCVALSDGVSIEVYREEQADGKRMDVGL